MKNRFKRFIYSYAYESLLFMKRYSSGDKRILFLEKLSSFEKAFESEDFERASIAYFFCINEFERDFLNFYFPRLERKNHKKVSFYKKILLIKRFHEQETCNSNEIAPVFFSTKVYIAFFISNILKKEVVDPVSYTKAKELFNDYAYEFYILDKKFKDSLNYIRSRYDVEIEEIQKMSEEIENGFFERKKDLIEAFQKSFSRYMYLHNFISYFSSMGMGAENVSQIVEAVENIKKEYEEVKRLHKLITSS